jgi:chemotaxis signal transduction protein
MVGTRSAPSSGWYIVFTLNNQKFALNSDNLLELVKADGRNLTKVPGASQHMAGLMNHRGNVLPVIDLRTVIGVRSFAQEVADMEELLRAREADHVGWLEDLRTSVHTDREFKKALDPKLCAFGKWYESVRSNPAQRSAITDGHLYLEKILDELDAPHRRIHGIAAEVLGLAASGRHEEAYAKIDLAWETDLAQMKILFKRFFQAFAALRVPLTMVMMSEGVQFACLVDRADYVGYVEESEFQPAPELTLNGQRLARYSMAFGNETALLFDVEAIIESVIEAPVAA